MATITTTTHADGAVLSADAFNQDMYSATAGRGVMSEANGGLDSDNYDTTSTPNAEHIFPEALARTWQDFTRLSFQVFGDAVGGVETTQSTVIGDTDRYMKGIPCGRLRIELPEDAAALLWNINVFVSPQRLYEIISDGEETPAYTSSTYLCLVAVHIDGVLQAHTVQPIPFGALHYRTQSGSVNYTYFDYAARSAQRLDWHILQTSVSAGWHDIELRIYIEDPIRTKATPVPSVKTQRKVLTAAGTGTETVTGTVHLSQAVVFGVSGARALALF
jgi:hypothetical protein